MSSNNNDFVVFGTPLEHLEEDEVPKKRPAPDLTVRDERGRQRFHGAFTGGFSAGYFNTVGTKEGWAPASFTSSRKKKADGFQQHNPEDFMDEEDLNVFGIAPRRMQTTRNFRDESTPQKRPFSQPTEGPIPGEPPLKDLIRPVSDSIGIKLLKKMGWKPGQGIGPRVKKTLFKIPTGPTFVKTFGCALPPADSEDADDVYAEGHTFAPKDVATLPYTPKDNMFGIGYSGLASGIVSKTTSRTSSITVLDKRGKKMSIHGQAFGVGALENEDEDIYAKDDMMQYDFALDDPELDKNQKAKKIENKVHHVQKALEGFHLAKNPKPPKKHFPPPDLPKHFRPIHKPSPGVHLAELEPPVEEHNRFLDRHSLTATDRAIILDGHYQGSVFDLISEEDKKRLNAIKLGKTVEDKATKQMPTDVARTVENKAEMPTPLRKKRVAEKPKPVFLGSAEGSKAVTPEKSIGRSSVFGLLSDEDRLRITDDQRESSSGAEKAVRDTKQLTLPFKDFHSTSFKPFIKDKAKQERYEQFLIIAKAGDREKLESLQPSTMTEWEKQKEMEEFYRAALLYKPLAASLGSRFTSATNQENDDNFVEVSIDRDVNQDDQEKAASMKMFGHLTRSSFEWHPDKILCRRFNVPNPFPDSAMTGLPKVKRNKVSIFNFLTTEDEMKRGGKVSNDEKQIPLASEKSTVPVEEPKEMEIASTSETVELQEKGVDEENKEDAASDVSENERPPMDLFKAIFQDTDSDKEHSSESEEEQSSLVEEVPKIALPVRKQIPAKGVFANLDLDALCSRSTEPRPVGNNNQKLLTSKGASDVTPQPSNTKPQETSMMYGPALPPNLGTEASSPQEMHVKSRKPKKHKNKKHKHKSKKSKHKSKHSHKYETKDRPDSDESSDSSISNMEIIQKMVEIYRRNH